MIYKSQFKDYNNNDTYYLTIDTNSGSSEREIHLSFSNPAIIIHDSAEIVFEPIKTYSATLSIVDKQYLMDIYNTGYNVSVIIKNDADDILFRGYVTPNVYDQDWYNVSTIEVECVSPVAMMKYTDYSVVGSVRETVSIYSILRKILYENCGYSKVYFPRNIGYDNHVYEEGFDENDVSILDDIYLDEQNFFDDDEDETPWKMYDVLSEICRFLGLSLVENKNEVWFVDYTNLSDYMQVDFASNTKYTTYDNDDMVIITSQSYGGSNNSLSLENVYRNIKFEVNTYPYEKIFPDILDSDKWVLDNEVYRGSLNTAELPSLYPVELTAGKKKDQKWWLCYWFYFTSNLMTFYDYYTDENKTIYYNTNEQIMELKPGRQGKMNYIGASLMKYGNYEITDPSVVASLDWTPAVVINSGLNYYNINDYRINNTSYDQEQFKLDCAQHIVNMCAHNDSEPVRPIVEIESDNEIVITDKSYLVISGSALLSDTPYEDPSQEEYKGRNATEKYRFEHGNQFVINLEDQHDKDKRYYVGHPLFYMSIAIGKWQLMSEMVEKEDEEGNKYFEIEYTWYDRTSGGNINPWIEIPVGNNEFSFYKTYDITNTCDWRLGLDNKKGFCIPLYIGLNGKLKVSIFGPCDQLAAGSYVYDIFNLPNIDVDLECTVDYNPLLGTDTYKWQVYANGSLPNYVIIKKLKVEICPVKYFTISDLLEKNSDNKKTDHVYENLISINNVEEFESVTLKINTQDPAKQNSFSSVKKLGQNGFEYIEKMTLDGGQTYKIQEENLVDKYCNHFGNIKTKFTAELKHNFTEPINPLTWFYQPMIKNGTNMVLNGYEWDLKAGNTLVSLIEI